MKDADGVEADGGAVTAAAPAPAGDGVAGGFDVAVDAGLGCGAAGGAGVEVDAEGVEGVAVLGAAGAAFGLNFHELGLVSKSARRIPSRPCTPRNPSLRCCMIPRYSCRAKPSLCHSF